MKDDSLFTTALTKPGEINGLNVFRPALFRADREEESELLAELLSSNKGSVTIHDTLEAQLRCLIETRYPAETLSRDALNDKVSEHLGSRKLDDYGVWVYYSWSERIVHILPEAEFIELRTSRNQYKITPEEQAALGTKIVGVVGLSVGQSVALTMAIERSFGEIRLAGFDELELSNLNRLRCGLHSLGLPKVVIAAREIAEIDPFLKVRCFPEGITEANIDAFLTDQGKLSLLVEECDSIDIKFLCRERAKAHQIPVIMDTSDRGMIDVERFDLEPNRPPFHGLVQTPELSQLKELSSEDKVPYILGILEQEKLSTRIRASMLEVANSIPTWPQLATSVALGGAITGDVCRRILLDQFRASGRYRVDLEDLISDETVLVADESVTQNETGMEAVCPDPAFLADALPEDSTAIDVGEEAIRELVSQAALAPSAGNLQPWIWIWAGQRLWLCQDRSRTLHLDAHDSATYIALGAATENLILAAGVAGWCVQCQREPLPDNETITAVFSFHECSGPEPASKPQGQNPSLYPYLALRLTNRNLSKRVPIEDDAIQSLTYTAQGDGHSSLQLLTMDADLAEAGEVISAGDRLRMLHPLGHDDFVNEIRWTPLSVRETRDGVDIDTVDLTDAERAGMDLLRDWKVVNQVRKLGGGKGFESLSRNTVEVSSAIGLLRAKISKPSDFLEAGRLVQRVWLDATRLNLAFQPMGGILFFFAHLHDRETGKLSPEMEAELPTLWERFVKLFPLESGLSDVFMFRLAIADEPKVRSLRRRLDDVLVIA